MNTVEQKFPSEKAALSFFSRKPRKLKVAFAFESTPEKCLVGRPTTTWHGNVWSATWGTKSPSSPAVQVPNGESSYGPLKELMEEGAVEHPVRHQPQYVRGRPAAFHRKPGQDHFELRFRPGPRRNIMTYYAKFYEAAFLCGVMAGPMTRTGLFGLHHHHHGNPPRLHLQPQCILPGRDSERTPRPTW